jgi:hypothetical protein
MFRDTFAVKMLLAGVPLEQVSNPLGPQERKDHREALRALGEGSTGTTGTER